MSSYVLMKVLESTPTRYDRGIRLISRGTIGRVYERVAEIAATPGARVLDLGCGTGGLSLACAARGARVVGIDKDPGMLEVAKGKAASGDVEWIELGAMEIEDRFEPETFDAVVSCLMFSELFPEEREYVLSKAAGLLVPDGLLVVADEVLPPSAPKRFVRNLVRWPLAAATWLATQTTTHAVEDLSGLISKAGFQDVHEEHIRPAGIAIVRGANQGLAA
jgi:demethylmenaquinone methyltransferase/2-methoxy-6-polyprenyl-1,4-benzoquinol methylase